MRSKSDSDPPGVQLGHHGSRYGAADPGSETAGVRSIGRQKERILCLLFLFPKQSFFSEHIRLPGFLVGFQRGLLRGGEVYRGPHVQEAEIGSVHLVPGCLIAAERPESAAELLFDAFGSAPAELEQHLTAFSEFLRGIEGASETPGRAKQEKTKRTITKAPSTRKNFGCFIPGFSFPNYVFGGHP